MKRLTEEERAAFAQGVSEIKADLEAESAALDLLSDLAEDKFKENLGELVYVPKAHHGEARLLLAKLAISEILMDWQKTLRSGKKMPIRPSV